MATSMKVTGILTTFKQLKQDIDKEQRVKNRLVVNNMVMALRGNTPVDTGHARDSWRVKPIGPNFDVINDVPYIDKLNEGSSKQAPSHFIESTALHYGKPVGAIVDHE